MASKKKTGKHTANKRASNFSVPARNLPKSDLGAVIFGCKNHTIQECFSKKLFGLPALHFAYVKKVSPGLPLFLFNYSDRKLHGIFEAAGHGQLNIDAHAWTGGSVELTQYPAQVQFNIYKRCHALTEDQFSSIIADNYYQTRLFWFELDPSQTAKLIELFSSSSAPYDGLRPSDIPITCTSEASTSHPQSNACVPFEHKSWSSLFQDNSTSDVMNKFENLKIVSSHPTSPLSMQSNDEWKSQTSHLINKSGESHKVCAEWVEGHNTQPLLKTPGPCVGGDKSDNHSVVAELRQEVSMLKEMQMKLEERIGTLEKEKKQAGSGPSRQQL